MKAKLLCVVRLEFHERIGEILFVLRWSVAVVGDVRVLVRLPRLLHLGVGACVFAHGSLTWVNKPRVDICGRVKDKGYLRVAHLQGRRDSNPQPSVLETDALPIEPLPCVRSSDSVSESKGRSAAQVTSPSRCSRWEIADLFDQRVSLWGTWLRHQRQNFFISMRSRVLTLDFVVM